MADDKKFAGCSVEYIGPGRAFNEYLKDPRREDQTGVAPPRLPRARPRAVSVHVAAVCAQYPEQFIVRREDEARGAGPVVDKKGVDQE